MARPTYTEEQLEEARWKVYKALQAYNNVFFAILTIDQQKQLRNVAAQLTRAKVVEAKIEQELHPQAFLGQGIGEK